MTLPLMPPADGGPWQWNDPHRRRAVTVPGAPACIYDVASRGAVYQPCGQPGQRYPSGYRCPAHAPATQDVPAPGGAAQEGTTA